MVKVKCTAKGRKFRNEENGYTVFSAVDETGKEITVTGNFADYADGREYVLEGEWRTHPRYGRQFEAKRYEETAPVTAAGIEAYLSSGLIGGIGEHYAHVLVKAFGEKTLEVIEKSPKKLLKVEGIGPKRAESIVKSFKEQKEVRNVMLFLKSYDVPNGLAVKIYKTYGQESIHTLRENPYRVADDVRGVGFLKADQIARSMGVAPDDPHRLRTGTVHVIEEMMERDGHTWADRGDLVGEASKLMGVEEGKVADAVAAMVTDGKLDAVEDCIYLPYYHRCEAGVADAMLSLAGAGRDRPVDDKELDAVQKACGVTFEQTQADAIRTAVTSSFSVMTGGPGTGKTTTTRGIVTLLEKRGLKVLLAAPTGRAAKRLSEATGRPAKTLHRLLEVNAEGRFVHDADTPLSGGALVVDESSMVDIRLMWSLLQTVPHGMKVVLVGDADQLPSIGPGNVLRDAIRSGAVPVIRLTKVFRQAARSAIVRGAHTVNRGQIPDIGDGPEDDLLFVPAETPEEIAAAVTDCVTRLVPERFGIRPEDVQVLAPQKNTAAGTAALNAALQARLNPGEGGIRRPDDELRPGDRVMQTRNNYEKGVMNGEMGTVTAVDRKDRRASIAFADTVVIYEGAELSDIVLSYAVTVHKSQGSEYPAVVMPLTKSHAFMLQRTLLYTAMTRAKKACVLVGTRDALRYAVYTNTVRRRNSLLCERLRGEIEEDLALVPDGT